MATSSCADLRPQCSTPLDWMLSRTPAAPRCSGNKTAARRLPRHKAVAHSYMQVNHPNLTSTLVFDLDHTNALIWDDAGLPAPNLIVRDPASGRAHLYYAIEAVSTGPRSRSKPIQYMRAVYDAFAERLRADRNYHSGPVAKTPGHWRWHTEQLHSHAYCLGELAEHVELASRPPWRRPSTKEDEVGESRNCHLFKRLRLHAYAVVAEARKRGSFETFVEHLRDYAEGHNHFGDRGHNSCLPASEIRSLVKSVSRWTWDNYRAGGRSARVMDLSPDLPLRERQRLSAARTHALRKEKTARRIRAACASLRARGKRISQAAVAREARLACATVGAHKHLLEIGERDTGTTVGSSAPANPAPTAAETTREQAAPGETLPSTEQLKSCSYDPHQVNTQALGAFGPPPCAQADTSKADATSPKAQESWLKNPDKRHFSLFIESPLRFFFSTLEPPGSGRQTTTTLALETGQAEEEAEIPQTIPKEPVCR